MLRLAQGRIDEASTLIRRALDEPEPASAWGSPPGSELSRLSLLPAEVEIALAAGDPARARRAADEVIALADRYASTASRATAAMADGLVLLAEGHPAEAAHRIRGSIGLWGELDAPWEVARARMALARAYTAIGDARAAVGACRV
jgi:hypothetical protein